MKRQFLQILFQNSSVDSSSSSSSSSSSNGSCMDSEIEFNFRRKLVRNENYFEETVPSYSEEEYKRHFRMSRSSALKLCEIINLDKKYVGGWPEITKPKAIHITLHYLANTNTVREVADKFNVTESACHNIISLVTKKIKEISSQYIKLPHRGQPNEISEVFQAQGALPYVVGAIDGTHLQIPRPKEQQEDYYNRKGYHSIVMQGVVTYNKTFVDIYVGEPGSLHDARVLKKSPIYDKLERTHEMEPYYFLGDTAYPAFLRWLVPPYKDNGNLSANQKDFNFRLSKTRIIVEHAFGLLKGRFRRLTQFNNRKIDFVINCTVAAVVLHNLCIMWDDMEEDFFNEVQQNEIPYEDQNQENIVVQEEHVASRRDELFNFLYNN